MNIDIDLDTLPQNDFKNYTLVDIREEEEIFISPSLIPCPHVPLSGFPDNKTFFNKNDSYLIFCAKGGRSHHMAEFLSKEGYKTFSVNDGISSINAYLNSRQS